MTRDACFRLSDDSVIRSPALLIDLARVNENLRSMIALAGGTARLRPHIKTHKMANLTRRQIELGIGKFKCATLREAELAAECGAPDILLAYQPVGPNVRWLRELTRAFPTSRFSALIDDPAALRDLIRADVELDVMLDLDVGQHRTGIVPGENAATLYRRIAESLRLRPVGLHAYDGHIQETDVSRREAACHAAFAPVAALRARLIAEGLPVPRVVAGGTPTFPVHSRRVDVECSPGTCVLWDAGYGTKFPDLPFVHAAILLTRVVSAPGPGRLCLDLGHKAVASEMPHPRVIFPEIPDAIAVAQSEEHLVIETSRAADFGVGSTLQGIPWHICPTVALHETAIVIDDAKPVAEWAVGARRRGLGIERA